MCCLSKKTVIIAMSGGVDSSVSAYYLLSHDYNVVGVTLAMGRTCDNDAILDAKKVAAKLGIEHYVLDVADDFKSTVEKYFIDSYIAGETPNPCAVCNRYIKFKYLIDFMHKIGADCISTGHYARLINNNDVYELRKGLDVKKDQSYFLSHIPYDYLQCLIFPCADLHKTEVRKIAESIGLSNAQKAESQDICFIDTNYKEFLIKNGHLAHKGLIKHLDGRILGEHSGIINYTIGQRKGLGISNTTPLYVVKLDSETNTVYVGDDDSLLEQEVRLKNLNVLNNLIFRQDLLFTFKLRSSHTGQDGKIKIDNSGYSTVVLDKPTRAVTKGQLCTIYYDDLVLGAGWIC